MLGSDLSFPQNQLQKRLVYGAIFQLVQCSVTLENVSIKSEFLLVLLYNENSAIYPKAHLMLEMYSHLFHVVEMATS